MKVNTISLNSVRLNTIALNHIGEIRSGGGGSKPSPIPQWIREHISFYYDMSKPMDVYPDDFGKWTKSTDSTFKVTSTNITITNLKAEKVSSVYIGKGGNFKGMKIRVSGLVDGQELYWGYWNNSLLRIPSNGDYTLSPIEQAVDNLGVRSGNIVGDCNITIEMLPSGKSVPTNEILKVSGYLQDLSGRKRNMKLNNFLFDMMSGVDGYKNESFETVPGNTNIKWKHLSYYSIQGKPTQKATDFGLYRVKNNANKFLYLKWNIEGIQEGNKVYLAQYNNESTRIELTNGVSDIALDTTNSDNPGYSYVVIISDQPYSTDITITQIPEYPGALVTDGVDDYGLVENLSSGVKMLFMTVNPMSANKILYAQRKQSTTTYPFAIYNGGDVIAYNYMNPNGATYIDGILNKSAKPNVLIGTKHVVTIVNDGVDSNNSKTPMFFNEQFANYYSKLAFYNSIAFDSIPTEADGFTEQELIDYVLTNIIGQ
nr:MAG TPA: hypothetical protein [Bacteriophage sp.]